MITLLCLLGVRAIEHLLRTGPSSNRELAARASHCLHPAPRRDSSGASWTARASPACPMAPLPVCIVLQVA
eukprot:7068441-Alexandrium_andersonii.AAC.1